MLQKQAKQCQLLDRLSCLLQMQMPVKSWCMRGISARSSGLCEQGSDLRVHAQVGAGNYDDKKYCSSLKTSSLTPVQKQGNYAQFSIPISSFQCPFDKSQITQVGFQNADGQLVSFCLDDIKIVSSGGSGGQVSASSVQTGRRLKTAA